MAAYERSEPGNLSTAILDRLGGPKDLNECLSHVRGSGFRIICGTAVREHWGSLTPSQSNITAFFVSMSCLPTAAALEEPLLDCGVDTAFAAKRSIV